MMLEVLDTLRPILKGGVLDKGMSLQQWVQVSIPKNISRKFFIKELERKFYNFNVLNILKLTYAKKEKI